MNKQNDYRFLFLFDNAYWYRERNALCKYVATAAGTVFALILFLKDKLPPDFFQDHNRLFAAALLLLGTTAVAAFLAYYFNFRGRFFYGNYEEIKQHYGQGVWWKALYGRIMKARRPVEAVLLYTSFMLMVGCFFTAIIVVTYLVFLAFW